jgi:hypothetical protein
MTEEQIDESTFALAYYSEGALTPTWAETLTLRRRRFYLDKLEEELDRKQQALERERRKALK